MPSAGFPVKVGTYRFAIITQHIFLVLFTHVSPLDIPVFPTVSGTATFTRHEAKQVDTALFDIPPYPPKKHKQKQAQQAASSSSANSSPNLSPSSSGEIAPPKSPEPGDEGLYVEEDGPDDGIQT